jgi:hypothetical protein
MQIKSLYESYARFVLKIRAQGTLYASSRNTTVGETQTTSRVP